MEITVKAEIEMPGIPDHFMLTDGQTIPIEAVEEECLEEIGKAWTVNLINEAKKRRGE